MIAFRNIFCYSGWKSLHILIAIIKLSGLNVFICIYIFCGRCRTKKCSSNQNARSKRFNWLSYLSVNVCICIPPRTLFAQTWYVISAFTHAVQTARMAGKHQQPNLPSWYCSTFTNCAIKFSHRWMTCCCPAVPNSSPHASPPNTLMPFVWNIHFELESWRNIWWCPFRRALMTYSQTEKPSDVIRYTYEMCRAGRARGL